MKKLILLSIIILASCQNRDINEGEEFRPRAVRDDFNQTHFTLITVDGVEYLMTERDNNNPHEGFGFMAFRANKMIEKQDSVLSYLRSMQHYQNKMYARMFNISEEEAQAQFNETFDYFMQFEKSELTELEKEDLVNYETEESPELEGIVDDQ